MKLCMLFIRPLQFACFVLILGTEYTIKHTYEEDIINYKIN